MINLLMLELYENYVYLLNLSNINLQRLKVLLFFFYVIMLLRELSFLTDTI